MAKDTCLSCKNYIPTQRKVIVEMNKLAQKILDKVKDKSTSSAVLRLENNNI